MRFTSNCCCAKLVLPAVCDLRGSNFLVECEVFAGIETDCLLVPAVFLDKEDIPDLFILRLSFINWSLLPTLGELDGPTKVTFAVF
jgi:hypothetical protein